MCRPCISAIAVFFFFFFFLFYFGEITISLIHSDQTLSNEASELRNALIMRG